MSILRNPELRDIFGIPPHVLPVAYLCVGYTDEFPEVPVLETVEWGSREALAGLVHYDRWGTRTPPAGWEPGPSRRASAVLRLLQMIGRVAPLDRSTMLEASARQEHLTKPPGSLGRLERLAIQVAGITGGARPR